MLAGTIDLRPITDADTAFLRAVFADARRDDFADLQNPGLDQLLDLQFRAQAADRAARHPGADTSVVLLDGEAVGTITVDRSAPDAVAHLVDIALLSTHRGQGIGSQLLAGLLDSAERVTLSVWSLNAGAIRLYERHGFLVDAEQSGYLWMSAEGHV
jgi:ribosomal protein S18 acetylase RimI-like enzyme